MSHTAKHCFLILATNAPNYRPMQAAIGTELQARGHKVIYAVTSPLASAQHPDFPLRAPVYDFSLFLCETAAWNSEPLPKGDVWKMLFPDIDRFRTLGHNRGKNINWYRDLSRALSAFFRRLIHDDDVDCILYEGVACSFSYFAYAEARQLGRAFFGLNASRIPGRFEILWEALDNKSSMAHDYRKILDGHLRLPKTDVEAIRDYIDNILEIEPDYMKSSQFMDANPLSRYVFRRSSWQQLMRTAVYVMKGGRQSFETGKIPQFLSHVLARDAARPFRIWRSRRYLTFPKQNERFFLYPLHYHPESSTSVFSRFYVDELATIRNIALCLPFERILYVKDHRSAIGNQPLSFYRELSDIPNVRLVSAECNARRLIRASDGVITLTSTVGYEAIILGKPVYALGDCFYDFHPLVMRIRDWEELVDALQNCIPVTPDSIDVEAFVGSYWQNTFYGSFDWAVVPPHQEMVQRAVDAVVAKCVELRSGSQPATTFYPGLPA